jgi:Holliday junction resolvase-like predicted endonuclease
MQALVDLTPQARGRRFNAWIAELLGLHGVVARADNRSLGEIDVAFSIGDTRYILEAKWTTAKADTGQLAKLQKRVRQRLAGTCGVFVSMSGYTAEALSDLANGERLEMLLLDGDHVEAMLFGWIEPEDLLSRLRDEASFSGRAYTPMTEIISPEAPRVAHPKTATATPQAAPSRDRRNTVWWNIGRESRANPSGGYVAFVGYHGVYWTVAILWGILGLVTLIGVFYVTVLYKLLLIVALAFEIGIVRRSAQLALKPLRLEIGTEGLQLFYPGGAGWVPWAAISRGEVMRVAGVRFILLWIEYGPVFPPFGEVKHGPTWMPSLNAVAFCSLSQIRGRRSEVIGALRRYSGNRFG